MTGLHDAVTGPGDTPDGWRRGLRPQLPGATYLQEICGMANQHGRRTVSEIEGRVEGVAGPDAARG